MTFDLTCYFVDEVVFTTLGFTYNPNMILDFAYEGWCYLYSNDIFDTFKMHWYIMTCILLISEPTSINKCLYNFSKNTHCASALIISNKNFQKFVIYEIHPL